MKIKMMKKKKKKKKEKTNIRKEKKICSVTKLHVA